MRYSSRQALSLLYHTGKETIAATLRGLYKTHSRNNRYSSDSILKLINHTTELDFSIFFERYIYGNEVISVGHYFDIGWLMFNEIGAPIGEKEQQVLKEMLTFEVHSK